MANPFDQFSGQDDTSAAPTMTPQAYDAEVRRVAAQENVDPALIRSVVHVESHGDPYAVSEAGAGGLMQLMPATAEEVGVQNQFDWRQNLRGGARYLKQGLERYSGNRDLAVAYYHGGPDESQWGPKTEDYVRKVGDYYDQAAAGQQKQAAQPNPFDQFEGAPAAGGNAFDQFDTSMPTDATHGLDVNQHTRWQDLPLATTGAGQPGGDPAMLANSARAAGQDASFLAEHPGPATADALAALPAPVTSSAANSPGALGHIWTAIKEGWEGSQGILTPEAQSWLDRTGLGGVTRLADIALAAPNAVFRGGQQTVQEIFKSAGMPQLGRDLAAMPEAFMGTPEMVPQATEAAPRTTAEAVASDVAEAKSEVARIKEHTRGRTSVTPTLDAVAEEARQRVVAVQPPAEAAAEPAATAAAPMTVQQREAVLSQLEPPEEVHRPPIAMPQPEVAEPPREVAAAVPELRPNEPAALPEPAPAAVIPEPRQEEPAPAAGPRQPPSPRDTPYVDLPKQPQRLVDYLRSIGGVKDPAGDIRSTLGGAKYRPGLVNNKSGIPLDEATHRAWEAGFFPEAGSRPDINHLLDAVEDDLRGTPRYSMADIEQADNYHQALERNMELDRLANYYELPTKGISREEFFDQLHDRMSQEQRAQEMASQEAAIREDARGLESDAGDADLSMHDLTEQSQARTLKDLEDEYRQEMAPTATEQRSAGAAEPAGAAAPEAAREAVEGPGGLAAGDAGRGEAQGSEPRAVDFETYAAERGASRQDIGDAGLHRSSLNTPRSTHERYVKAQLAKDAELVEKRSALREQYDAEVASGKIRPLTAMERLEERAAGHPDLESTKAAQRLLAKRQAAASAGSTDLLGRQLNEPAAPAQRQPAPTIRNDERQVGLPGTEPSAVQAQAARDAGRGTLTGDVPQKPANEGLFAPDTSGQGAMLYSFPAALFEPEAWRRAFGPLAPTLKAIRSAGADVAQSVADGVAPIQAGTSRARAFAANFANSLRKVQYRYGEIDRELERNFTPAQREQMGRALDAQSVFEQQVRALPEDQRAQARAEFDAGKSGVAGLSEKQRQSVEALDAISQDVWRRMQERGLVAPNAQGLPYYMPRQILMWSEAEGFKRPGGGGGAGRGMEGRGANLTTSGPMRREHLTPEETLAAAKAKLGAGAQLLSDIRSLPSRLAFSERSIAGVDLMNAIDKVGKDTGVNLVVKGDIPGMLEPGDYFTMADHPSFRRWTGSGWQPVHIAKEFEGPLKAVLTKASPTWYRAMMQLKGGVMSSIMYSPFIHLAVELGRSLPVMPLRILTLRALRDGSVLRHDLDYMDRATRDGLAPLGHSGGWATDPASIADQAINPASRNRFIRALAGARDVVASGARTATGAIAGDRAGQFVHDAIQHPHQTLLWDQIFNLQLGIYDAMRSRYIAKGFDPEVAGTMAAHLANRYAGALPAEHLSKSANMIANLSLFSRSFTLGNLGVMKDMLSGAPKHVISRIEQMAGPEAASAAQSALRRKAIGAFVMDIGLFYAANGLLQAGLQQLRGEPAVDEWLDEAASAIQAAKGNPLSIFGVLPQHWNEPGKQDRVYAGTDSTGRGVYLRLPPGKVGEEFIGWFAKPGTMLVNKASPIVRPIIEEILGYDSLGRQLLPPNPQTIGDYVDAAGSVVKHIAEGLGPTSTIQGIHELYQQYVQGKKTQADPYVSALKVLGPLTGAAQVSQGYPGGPAAGELHAQSERQRYAIQQAMPDIRDKIRNGKTDEAIAAMTKLGVNPTLQRYYIRQTLNPQPSKSQRRMFETTASPEAKERMQRHENAAP